MHEKGRFEGRNPNQNFIVNCRPKDMLFVVWKCMYASVWLRAKEMEISDYKRYEIRAMWLRKKLTLHTSFIMPSSTPRSEILLYCFGAI